MKSWPAASTQEKIDNFEIVIPNPESNS